MAEDTHGVGPGNVASATQRWVDSVRKESSGTQWVLRVSSASQSRLFECVTLWLSLSKA